MESLQDYLDNDYLKDKDQTKSLKDLIIKVLPFYENFNTSTGWPYQLGDEPKDLSTSTTSMLIFSMSVMMGGNIDLIISDKCENYFKVDGLFNVSEYSKILENSKKIVTKKFIDNGNKFISPTYGNNDPFTIMWVSYLVDC